MGIPGWCRFPDSLVVTMGKSFYGKGRGALGGVSGGVLAKELAVVPQILFLLYPKISLSGRMNRGLTALVLILCFLALD